MTAPEGERHGADAAAAFRPLPPDADTVVIGGGVTGLSATLFLAREGVDVLCLDGDLDAGSNANAGSLHVQMQSRLLREFPELGVAVERELPVYVEAVAAWRRLAEELDADIGIIVGGGLMIAEDERQLAFLAGKIERERAHGIAMEIWDRDRLEREAPYLSRAVIGAAFCPLEGKVDPLAANRAIARAASSAGAQIARGVRVSALAAADGALEVRTTRGTVRCRRAVIAAGAGARALAADIGLAVPVEAEPLQVAITEAAAPIVHHLVQHADRPITMKQLAGGQIVVGGGWPARPRAGVVPPAVMRENLVGNLALARHIVPAIAPLRLLRTWAGVNPLADGRPIVGADPARPEVIFAVPGDAGYTLGPLIGALAAACVLDRPPPLPIDRYRPGRFAAPPIPATSAGATTHLSAHPHERGDPEP